MKSVIVTCEAQTETMLRRLGMLILIWRKQLCLTQSDLSVRTGILQSYISNLETGSVDPRLSTLYRVLQGLDNMPFVTFFEGPEGIVTLEYPITSLSLPLDDDHNINFH